jgi:UDP-N-acetylglucosamine 2-epimerase (non-hydrolysing)
VQPGDCRARAGRRRADRRRGVAKVAREQRNEIGETGPEPPPLPRAPAPHALRVATAPRRPVLFVVASLSGHVRAAALMAAMAERVGSPPIKLVRVHDDDALALSGVLFDGLELNHAPITLGCPELTKETRSPELERRFRDVVDKASPKAVVVFDGGNAGLGCVAIARSMGIPVVRVGTGLPVEASRAVEAAGRESAEDLADLWYPSDEQASQALANEGVPAARIHCAGNLFIEAVQTASSALQDPMRSGAFHRMVIPLSSEDWCYALVLIEEPRHVADRQSVVALIAFLRRISRSVALVLLMRSDAEHEFNKHRLHREIFGERICHLPAQAYANQVELLRNATCVLTDSRDVREEAIALDVPCLAIGIRAESALPAPGRTATTGREAHAAAWATGRSGRHGFARSPGRSDRRPYRRALVRLAQDI